MYGMYSSDVSQVRCYQDKFFVYQVNNPQDSPEADADLVSETILCVCRNYPEVKTKMTIVGQHACKSFEIVEHEFNSSLH